MLNKGKNYEKQRKFVVCSVFFIYILFLIAGTLRKWFLPSLASPLTLLIDPFVLALYAYCLFYKLIMQENIARPWLGFAIFSSCFGLIQYTTSGYSLEGWILGVRAYWLYMPLAFIIPVTFRTEDVMRFFKLNLWLAMPYAILVATQYRASPYSFINRGVGGDEAAAVSVALNISRPFGLFTYTAPNVQFTTAIIAIFIATYLADNKKHPNKIVFPGMAIAVGAMGVLTGSRGIFFITAVILGLTILGLIFTRLSIATLVRVFFIFALVALANWLLVNIFPDMFEAINIRFQVAAASEGIIWNRVFGSFSFLGALETAPVLGQGIGAGASGVARFLGLRDLVFGESDLERNINELGVVFGSIFLLLRWLTSWWLIVNAIKLAHKGMPMALPLAGFVVVNFAVGQMTHSPLMSFFPWVLFGMVLACRNASTNLPIGWMMTSLPNTTLNR
jgi:hypothetical protein